MEKLIPVGNNLTLFILLFNNSVSQQALRLLRNCASTPQSPTFTVLQRKKGGDGQPIQIAVSVVFIYIVY